MVRVVPRSPGGPEGSGWSRGVRVAPRGPEVPRSPGGPEGSGWPREAPEVPRGPGGPEKPRRSRGVRVAPRGPSRRSPLRFRAAPKGRGTVSMCRRDATGIPPSERSRECGSRPATTVPQRTGALRRVRTRARERPATTAPHRTAPHLDRAPCARAGTGAREPTGHDVAAAHRQQLGAPRRATRRTSSGALSGGRRPAGSPARPPAPSPDAGRGTGSARSTPVP